MVARRQAARLLLPDQRHRPARQQPGPLHRQHRRNRPAPAHPWELRAGDRASWSPDGTQIVFTTYPAGADNTPGGGIYTVRPDGTAIGALTPGPSDVFYGAATYSPTARRSPSPRHRPTAAPSCTP
ncbi:hypothetical protein ACFQ0M_37690 [Kitasatospora aburaviensis]